MIENKNYLQYYGDRTRWFIGTVISINDPAQLGRVKIRIFGIHSGNTDDISDGDLPWAQTVVPITEGGSSGLGANVGIKERSQVFGFFLDGKDSQLPLVLGSIPKIEKPITAATSTTSNQATGKITLVNTSNPDDELLKGSSNVEKAFNFFISDEGGGFTAAQAAGIIGNFMQESRMDPTVISSFVGEGSIGIAQWNPATNRYKKLKDFADARNLSYTSLYAQLLYTKYELETIPYLGMSQLRAAQTAAQAAEVFCNKFERPNKNYAHIPQRVAYANEILEKMA